MIRYILVVAFSVSLLGGCSSSQSGLYSSPNQVTNLEPEKKLAACGGTNGVSVSPCPVTLTKHAQSGVVVTVSGPGVTSSAMKKNHCGGGRMAVCYFARLRGSDHTQWLVTPRHKCGTVTNELVGLGNNGSITIG